MEQKEIRIRIALLLSGTIASARLGRLLVQQGVTATQLQDLPLDSFQDSGLTATEVTSMRELCSGKFPAPLSRKIDGLLAKTEAAEADIIGYGDADYPALLSQIYDPPALLFTKGDRKLFSQPCLAVVGSRAASAQSTRFTRWLTEELASAGLCIVSGLARGIDRNAHLGAMETGQSIGVIGTGIDVSYPKSNQALQHQLESAGLLVSEYFPGTPPRALHFPQRNRIISGLCLGTLVVEATLRSGSLITARYAAEHNREVFAVPGMVERKQSRGCHQLIRDGATLVESAQDVIRELQGHGLTQLDTLAVNPVAASDWQPGSADPIEARILKQIATHGGLPQDLMKNTNLTPSQLSQILVKLELSGKIVNKGGRMQLRE